MERAVYSAVGLTTEQASKFMLLARASVGKLLTELDDVFGQMAREAQGRPMSGRVDVGINVFQFAGARDPESPIAALIRPDNK